jgi:autophagy-related protein 9
LTQDVLDLRLPWWASPFLGSEQLFLTKSLEWSLYFCVLQHIFNDQFNVSSVFLRDVKGLQSRFMMAGMVHFLLLPFMLVFMTVHFFLQNAQQFHSSKSYLGPRQWSPLALWTFREFNELPHVFETRINKSYAPANAYLQSFSNQYLSIVARCAAYVCGSFVAVLLLASVIDEAVLLYVRTADHNLLWYLGICSAAYAGARSVVPDETKAPGVAEQEELLDQVTAHTHFRGDEWTGRAHTSEVRISPPAGILML